MRCVLNCLDEEQTTIVGGSHFKFKPLEIKAFYNDNIAQIIVTDRKEYGFTDFPEKYADDLDWRHSDECRQLLEEKRKEGIDSYCARLRALVYNAQVSLKKDLDVSGRKEDPRAHMSNGDIKNMQQLLKYQLAKQDDEAKKIDQIKEMEKKLESFSKK